MARQIVRYLLEADGTVPKFVENGGYFQDGEWLIGVSVDEDRRRVPGDIQRLNKGQLLSALIEHAKSFVDHPREGKPKKPADLLSAFLEQVGMEDLADE